MLSSWLGGDMYQFSIHWLDSTKVLTHGFESDLTKWETDAQLIQALSLTHLIELSDTVRLHQWIQTLAPSYQIRASPD